MGKCPNPALLEERRQRRIGGTRAADARAARRKEKLGWGGGKVRAVQGLGEGAGATVREPAKLSGVASNPWQWRRRQVSGTLVSLWPGLAGAELLRSERDRCGSGRGSAPGPGLICPGAGGSWA